MLIHNNVQTYLPEEVLKIQSANMKVGLAAFDDIR